METVRQMLDNKVHNGACNGLCLGLT